MKMLKALEHLLYEERLWELTLLSLKKLKLRTHLINVYKYLMGGSKKDGAKLFLVVSSERKRGNVHERKYKKFPLKKWIDFFIVRMVKLWNQLPRENMEFPSLEVLNTPLDMALSSLLQLTLLWTRNLSRDQMKLSGLSNHSHSAILWLSYFCPSTITARENTTDYCDIL